MISKEEILNLFQYEKSKGELYWKNHWSKSHLTKLKGKRAGSVVKKTNVIYLATCINRKYYSIHQLIFFIEKGFWANVIDHKNGNGLDNRIENLRAVTNRQNNSNTYRHRNGKLVGASYIKSKDLWMSHVGLNNKCKNLGYFKTEIEAHNKYMDYLKGLENESV